jgi:hypothetical protein
MFHLSVASMYFMSSMHNWQRNYLWQPTYSAALRSSLAIASRRAPVLRHIIASHEQHREICRIISEL